MFPLQYCHFYCPLLPVSLLDYIQVLGIVLSFMISNKTSYLLIILLFFPAFLLMQAPMPFLVGVHTSSIAEILIPKDVCIWFPISF